MTNRYEHLRHVAMLDEDLRGLLNSKEAIDCVNQYSMYGDMTWTDGLCRILSYAFHLWLNPIGKQMNVVDARGYMQHAIYQIGNYYLDGDGISNKRQLLRRWGKIVAAPKLSKIGQEDIDRFGLYYNDDLAWDIATLFGTTFIARTITDCLLEKPYRPPMIRGNIKE